MIQTALERVVRTLRTGQFSGNCSLTTWVTIVARHLALDVQRARQMSARTYRHSSVPMAAVPNPLDLERQLEARSQLDQAMRVLDSMDDLTAEIIRMHDLAGHNLAEIAAATQTSISAAQSRLVRGRKELLRRLTIKLNR